MNILPVLFSGAHVGDYLGLMPHMLAEGGEAIVIFLLSDAGPRAKTSAVVEA